MDLFTIEKPLNYCPINTTKVQKDGDYAVMTIFSPEGWGFWTFEELESKDIVTHLILMTEWIPLLQIIDLEN